MGNELIKGNLTLADYLKGLRFGLAQYNEKNKVPSMREIAEDIGINHSYLARLESGEKKNATGVCLQRIVAYYSKYYDNISLEGVTSLCSKTNNEQEVCIRNTDIKPPKHRVNIEIVNKLLEISKKINSNIVFKTIQLLDISEKEKLMFFEVFALVQGLSNDNDSEQIEEEH